MPTESPFVLDHVQLAAPPGCERAARRFFGELLGLPEVPKPSGLAERGGVWFQCGAHQIHVGVEAEFSPARKAHPAFRLPTREALEALYARLSEGNVPVRRDDRQPGVRRFFAQDPWGNRLEFLAREAQEY